MLFRCCLAGQEDTLDADSGVELPMAAIAAVVLAATVLADDDLDRWVIDDFADDLHARHDGPTDLEVGAVVEQQHATELDRRALLDGMSLGGFFPFHGAEIDADDLAFADSVLPRAVFDNRVHASCSSRTYGGKVYL